MKVWMREKWRNVRAWVTLPRRWRELKMHLEMQEFWMKEHRELASEMGYLGCYHLEAAVKIARRCKGAEDALKRLADANERELAAGQVPGLSPPEIERLGLLAESCGRVAETVGKILQYGWHSAPPTGGRPPRALLERCSGQLQAVMQLFFDAGDLRGGDVAHYRNEKFARMQLNTRYQGLGLRG